MPIRAFSSATPLKRYDWVVLGAGNGGSAAAAALARRHPNASVALFEAGGDHADHPLVRVPGLVGVSRRLRHSVAKAWWRVEESVPQEFLQERKFVIASGRGLGGSSLVNDGMYFRGTRMDYAGWSDSATWSPDAITDTFAALRKSRRVTVERPSSNAISCPPNNAFINGCDAIGMMPVEMLNVDSDVPQAAVTHQVTRKGRRHDAYSVYCRDRPDLDDDVDIRSPPNLDTFTNATALRLHFAEGASGSGGLPVVSGVDIAPTGSKTPMRVECGGAISSLGAVHTPAFLQRSGVGPKAALNTAGVDLVAHNEHIGNNLVTQPQVTLITRFALPGASSRSFAVEMARHLYDQWQDYAERGNGFFASNVELSCIVKSTHKAALPDNRIDFMCHKCLGGPENPDAMGYGKGYTVRCVVVRGPHSPGTVRITSSDPTATPAIDPQMFQNPDERRSLDEAVAWGQVPTHPESGLRSDMSLNPHGVAHPFDELRVTPVSPDRLIAEKTLRNLYDGPNVSVDGCQLGGTCCIGKAVDERLQVRGVRGVWVADASIVPKRVQADMGLLAQMIGTKAGSELVGAESP